MGWVRAGPHPNPLPQAGEGADRALLAARADRALERSSPVRADRALERSLSLRERVRVRESPHPFNPVHPPNAA